MDSGNIPHREPFVTIPRQVWLCSFLGSTLSAHETTDWNKDHQNRVLKFNNRLVFKYREGSVRYKPIKQLKTIKSFIVTVVVNALTGLFIVQISL